MYQNNVRDRNCNCGCNPNDNNYCNVHSNADNQRVFYFHDEPAERMTYQAKYRRRWNYEDDCNC